MGQFVWDREYLEPEPTKEAQIPGSQILSTNMSNRNSIMIGYSYIILNPHTP